MPNLGNNESLSPRGASRTPCLGLGQRRDVCWRRGITRMWRFSTRLSRPGGLWKHQRFFEHFLNLPTLALGFDPLLDHSGLDGRRNSISGRFALCGSNLGQRCVRSARIPECGRLLSFSSCWEIRRDYTARKTTFVGDRRHGRLWAKTRSNLDMPQSHSVRNGLPPIQELRFVIIVVAWALGPDPVLDARVVERGQLEWFNQRIGLFCFTPILLRPKTWRPRHLR